MEKKFRNLLLVENNTKNKNQPNNRNKSLLSKYLYQKSKIQNASSLHKFHLSNLNSTNTVTNNFSNDTNNSDKKFNNINFYPPSLYVVRRTENNLSNKNNFTEINNNSDTMLPIITKNKSDTTYLSSVNYSNVKNKKVSFISPKIKNSSMSMYLNNNINIKNNLISSLKNLRSKKRELSIKNSNMLDSNNSFSTSKNNRQSKWAECQKNNYILLGKFIKIEEKRKHKKKNQNQSKIKNYEKLTISRSIKINTDVKYNIDFAKYVKRYLGRNSDLVNIKEIKIFGEELNEVKNELNDIVEDKSFDSIKMAIPLKIFFNNLCCNNQNSLKDKKKIKDFYKKIENRVNFLYDVYKIPYIKNKLTKVYKNFSVDNFYPEELNNLHFINNKVWKFNNMNKIILNAKNDMKKYANKEDQIKNNIEKYSNNIDDSKNNKDWVYSYNAENYFIHKKNLQRKTEILADEQKRFFYENFFE